MTLLLGFIGQCLAMQARQLLHQALLGFDIVLLGCHQTSHMPLMLCRATPQGLYSHQLMHLLGGTHTHSDSGWAFCKRKTLAMQPGALISLNATPLWMTMNSFMVLPSHQKQSCTV